MSSPSKSVFARLVYILAQDFTIVQLPSQSDPFTDLDDSADGSDEEDELL